MAAIQTVRVTARTTTTVMARMAKMLRMATMALMTGRQETIRIMLVIPEHPAVRKKHTVQMDSDSVRDLWHMWIVWCRQLVRRQRQRQGQMQMIVRGVRRSRGRLG